MNHHDVARPARSVVRRASVFGIVSLSPLAACGDDSSSSDTAQAATTVAAGTTAATGTGVRQPGEELPVMSAQNQAAVDAAIQKGIERLGAVGNLLQPPALYVGVWDPAKGVYLTAQGDAADGQPATVQDHFRIGSISKTFTSAVILQLIDEGKLALDDTVDELLADLAAKHPELEGITVESLLNMTSRIEDYYNVPNSVAKDVAADPTRVWALEELVAAGLKPGLLPEGTAKYSTTNMIILQMVAEKIEGKGLGESIKARLTDPLGMDQTSFPVEDPSIPEPLARANFNELCVEELTNDGAAGITTDTDPTGWNVSSAQGGGGMIATLADLGTWAASTSGSTFLSPELQAERLDTTTSLGEAPEVYGLGIFQLGDGWYGHSGEALGWQALAVTNPETGVTLAFASNVCAGQDLVYWSILNELYPDAELDAFLTAQLGG